MISHRPQNGSVFVGTNLFKIEFTEIFLAELLEGAVLFISTAHHIIIINIVIFVRIERTKCKLLYEIRVAFRQGRDCVTRLFSYAERALVFLCCHLKPLLDHTESIFVPKWLQIHGVKNPRCRLMTLPQFPKNT